EGGLEHERQLVALGEVAQIARHLEALRLRLDDVDPCDERERRAIAQSNRSDLQFGAPPDTTASVRPRRSASTAARSSSSRSGRAEVTRDQFGICGAPIGSRTNERPAARSAREKVSTATSSSWRSKTSPFNAASSQ